MRRSRNKEAGYALLLVFLMAAVLAISLYTEIPRVAFQSQRHKEQLLVERGEQFKRGIQVFQATTRQYPKSLDDLENYNGRHFLRHRYVDPMTGKDNWRLIHVQGNVVVDSIKSVKKEDTQSGKAESSYISAYAGLGQTDPTQASKPQDRRRASENPEAQIQFPGGAEASGGQSQPGAMPNLPMPGVMPMPGAAANPSQPGMPGAPGMTQQGGSGFSGMPGMQPSGGQQGQQASGGYSYISASPGLGVQTAPSLQNPNGVNPAAMGQPGMPGMVGAPGAPGAPTLPGFGSPSAGGVQASPSTASSLINDLLTRPNPQGAQAVQQALQSQGSNLIGGGGLIYAAPANGSGLGGATQGTGLIAGVASSAKIEAIMVYDDHTAYSDWEFIFDPAKVTPIPSVTGSVSGLAGQAGAAGGKMGTPGQAGTAGYSLGGGGTLASALIGQTGVGNFSTTGTQAAGQFASTGAQVNLAGLPGMGSSGMGGNPAMGQAGMTSTFQGLGQAGTGQSSATGQAGGPSSGVATMQGVGGAGATGAQAVAPVATLPPIRLGRP